MALADMVAGSIVIEQVFNIPGLGRILLTSISNRDYPVVQAIIVFIAFIVIFTNFLVDLLYQKMDPRITLDWLGDYEKENEQKSDSWTLAYRNHADADSGRFFLDTL